MDDRDFREFEFGGFRGIEYRPPFPRQFLSRGPSAIFSLYARHSDDVPGGCGGIDKAILTVVSDAK